MGKIREKKRLLFFSTGAILVLMLLFGAYSYTKTASHAVKQYMTYMNNRQYEKAYGLFYQQSLPPTIEKAAITDYMKTYFENNRFIKIDSKNRINSNRGSNKMQYYEVSYHFEGNTIKNVLSAVKDGNQFKLLFPFKIEQVSIYAPLGAKVYMNEKLVETYQNGYYLSDPLLPDNYTVRISYPNKVYEDYITTIQVPKDNQVVSPYRTMEVTVKAPVGLLVELSNTSKRSETGIVSFENVLEGRYILKVTHPDHYTQDYEKEIIIGENKTSFEVEEIILSKQGKEKLAHFIQSFYGEYLNGIKKQDDNFLQNYILSASLPAAEKEFAEWFIEKKKIVNASLIADLKDVTVTQDGKLNLIVMENIELDNKQRSEEGKDETVRYKVVLKTVNQVELQGDNCKIENREITESIVAYQDEQNNWIEY